MTLEKKHTSKTMSFGQHRDLDKVVTASGSDKQKRVNVNLDEDKHLRLKAACVKKGTSISEVIKELVDQWLKENE